MAAKIIIGIILSILWVLPVQAQIVIGPLCQAPFDPRPECNTPPAPPEPDPVILIPGMVISFNPQVTLRDNTGGSWDFAPFTRKIYQALIDRLNNQGIKEGDNLFIAYYDWRNPVDDAATNYLKPIINQAKQATGATKVDIIAHSMGGLVARSYIQSSDYDNDVDQLIMLGTPNLGAADAYVAWEGGILPDRWDPGTKVYLRVIESALRITRADPSLRPISFRHFFPSLKDLLPTEDYITLDGSPLPVTDMAEQNPFLQQLASTLSNLTTTTTTIAGSNVQTLNQINITSTPSFKNKIINIVLQRWRDGHPNPNPPEADTTTGDQTVLTSSALLGPNTVTIDNAKHDNLPEDTQNQVLAALGLDSSGELIRYDKADNLLLSLILSPVTQTITTPTGDTFTCDSTKQTGNSECVVDETDPNSPKLLVISNPPPGQYKITLTGTGFGEYHAITCFADEDEDSCTTRAGQTKAGKTETYSVNITEGSFEPPIEDITTSLCKLKPTIRSLMSSHDITSRAFKLHGQASRLCSFAKKWQKQASKHGLDSRQTKRWQKRTTRDYKNILRTIDNQINQKHFTPKAILDITAITDQIKL